MDPVVDDEDLRAEGAAVGLGASGSGVGGGEVMDQERRIRREIANSNERRRMQSINAGFQSLRTLLPHHEGEKLSKAAILQQTAEYIYSLEQEKTLLLSQNSQLKGLLSLNQQRSESGNDVDTSPQLKKKRIHNANEDASSVPGATTQTAVQEDILKTGTVTDINLQLMQEQRLRLRLEDRVKSLERQLSMSASPTATGIVVKAQENPKSLILTTGGTELKGSIRPAPPAVPTPPTRITVSAPTAILLQSNQAPVSPNSLPNVSEKSSVVPAAVLEAAVAATKKEFDNRNSVHVDVERISQIPVLPSMPLPPPSVTSSIKAEAELDVSTAPGSTDQRYIVTTATTATASSRQNLDSIVEAIRHLEGDHMFSEDHRHVKEEVVDYSSSETSGSSKVAMSSSPAVPNKTPISLEAIQLPQQPVSVISASRNNSGGNGIIILK